MGNLGRVDNSNARADPQLYSTPSENNRLYPAPWFKPNFEIAESSSGVPHAQCKLGPKQLPSDLGA
jgi:hypothetical protein